METVCKEVIQARRVNLENEEIKDIMKAIDIMMGRFIQALSSVNSEIKIDRLEFCGSMAEDTRLWKPNSDPADCDLEFDYLALMKTWPGCGEFWFLHSNTRGDKEEGEMQISYNVIDPQSVLGKRVYLNTDIKLAFFNMLLKGVKSECKRNFCTRQMSGSSSPIVPGCKCCTVYMKTGSLRCSDVPVTKGNKKESMLTFVWSTSEDHVHNPARMLPMENISPEPLSRDKFKIDVDFHPVIELNKERIQSNTDWISVPFDDTYSYFLFPFRNCDLNWRISTCTMELELLKNTSERHKEAFCVLKFICKALKNNFNLIYVDSYHTKCIVLNHIKSCKDPEKGTHLCLLEMVRDIHDCTKSKSLPHPFLPLNVYNMNLLKIYKVDADLCEAVFKLFDEHKEQYSIQSLIYDLVSLGILHRESIRVAGNNVYMGFFEERKSKSAEEVSIHENGTSFFLRSLKELFPSLTES